MPSGRSYDKGGDGRSARELDRVVSQVAAENPGRLVRVGPVGVDPRRSEQAEDLLRKLGPFELKRLRQWFAAPLGAPSTGIPSVVEELRPADLVAALMWSRQREGAKYVPIGELGDELKARYGEPIYDPTHNTKEKAHDYVRNGFAALELLIEEGEEAKRRDGGVEVPGFRLVVERRGMNVVCDYILALQKAETRPGSSEATPPS